MRLALRTCLLDGWLRKVRALWWRTNVQPRRFVLTPHALTYFRPLSELDGRDDLGAPLVAPEAASNGAEIALAAMRSAALSEGGRRLTILMDSGYAYPLEADDPATLRRWHAAISRAALLSAPPSAASAAGPAPHLEVRHWSRLSFRRWWSWQWVEGSAFLVGGALYLYAAAKPGGAGAPPALLHALPLDAEASLVEHQVCPLSSSPPAPPLIPRRSVWRAVRETVSEAGRLPAGLHARAALPGRRRRHE